MDREGLSRVKRAEYVARLEALERLIRAQEMRVDLYRSRGWDVEESERHLKLLRDSYALYRSTLMQLPGDDLRHP